MPGLDVIIITDTIPARDLLSAPLIRGALISADDCNYLIIEKINKISHLTAPADALSLSDLELNLCNICKRWRKIARSKTGAQD